MLSCERGRIARLEDFGGMPGLCRCRAGAAARSASTARSAKSKAVSGGCPLLSHGRLPAPCVLRRISQSESCLASQSANVSPDSSIRGCWSYSEHRAAQVCAGSKCVWPASQARHSSIRVLGTPTSSRGSRLEACGWAVCDTGPHWQGGHTAGLSLATAGSLQSVLLAGAVPPT